MKLLGWMHRKFRQNSGDPCRDLNTMHEVNQGHPCNCLSGRLSLEERQHHQYHYGYPKASKAPLRPMDDQFLYSEDDGGTHTGDPDEEAPPAEEELFQGLLAIGTLGSLGQADGEDLAAGAITPTFGVPTMPLLSADAIAEKEEGYEATEDDLEIINTELEKVLLLPEAEKAERLSSARASQVSAKQLVVSGCPLQEYLFGSLVDMAETTATAVGPQEKKEHYRTSLGELFMRSRMAEEEEIREKPTARMHLMVKKMLRRREPAGGSSRTTTCNSLNCAASDGYGSSGQANSETKFHRIMQMFRRKVHPDSSVAAKKATKASKSRSKATDGACRDINGKGLNSLMRKEAELSKRKDGTTSMARAAVGGGQAGCGDSSGNREYWIKTDAEYLVLEL